MPDRLTTADAALLQAEADGKPQHVGTVSICHDPGGRLDPASLAALVRARLPAAGLAMTVRRGSQTTYSIVAGIRGAPGRSTRSKTIPCPSQAGTKSSLTGCP